MRAEIRTHTKKPEMSYLIRKILLGRITLILGLAIACFGCRNSSSHEVARMPSPDGRTAAVLTESNGGATTSFGYDVSVGPNGSKQLEKIATLYGAVRNDQAYGVNLRWTDSHTLRVEYLKAKSVLNVKNTATVNGQQIQILLESGVEDPNAPAGGMLSNLRKQSR
jgi:hypothetical protein